MCDCFSFSVQRINAERRSLKLEGRAQGPKKKYSTLMGSRPKVPRCCIEEMLF